MKEKSLSEKIARWEGLHKLLRVEDVKESIQKLFCKENQIGIRESNDGKKYKIYILDEEDVIEELGKGLIGEKE